MLLKNEIIIIFRKILSLNMNPYMSIDERLTLWLLLTVVVWIIVAGRIVAAAVTELCVSLNPENKHNIF